MANVGIAWSASAVPFNPKMFNFTFIQLPQALIRKAPSWNKWIPPMPSGDLRNNLYMSSLLSYKQFWSGKCTHARFNWLAHRKISKKSNCVFTSSEDCTRKFHLRLPGDWPKVHPDSGTFCCQAFTQFEVNNLNSYTECPPPIPWEVMDVVIPSLPKSKDVIEPFERYTLFAFLV